MFIIHESVETCAEVCLKTILHPFLEDEIEHLSSFAGVLASYYVTLCQGLHLSDTQIAQVAYWCGHYNE